MAEHTSTRASSRRTTPKPAPQIERAGTQTPPKRTTRVTRSQSHDVSDSEDGRKSSKGQKGAKQASPAGTHGPTGQSIPKGRKGKSTNHAKIQQGKEFHVTRHTLYLLRQGYPCLQTRDVLTSQKLAVSFQESCLTHASISD